jgi:hypothetical protein
VNLSHPGPFPLLDIAALAGLCLLVIMTVGIKFSAPNAATGNRKVRENKEGK